MSEVWTAQLHIADGKASEDAPEIAYAERRDERGRIARLYLLAEPDRPGSEQFIDELVTAIGEEFVAGAGSLTGLLQRAIRERHEDLLDWNRNSLPRDQASYGVSCLIQRGDDWYLAQMGPSLIYYREGERLLRRRPASERSTPAIGTNETGAPEFSELHLGPDDWALLISSDVGATLPDDLLHSLRGLSAEDVLPSLYPHLRQRARLSALVVAPDPDRELGPAIGDLAAASSAPSVDGASIEASTSPEPAPELDSHAPPSQDEGDDDRPDAETEMAEPPAADPAPAIADGAPADHGADVSAPPQPSPRSTPTSDSAQLPQAPHGSDPGADTAGSTAAPPAPEPTQVETAPQPELTSDDRTPIGEAIRGAGHGLLAPLRRLFGKSAESGDDPWDPPAPPPATAPSPPAKANEEAGAAPDEAGAEEAAGGPDDRESGAEGEVEEGGSSQLSLDVALGDDQSEAPQDRATAAGTAEDGTDPPDSGPANLSPRSSTGSAGRAQGDQGASGPTGGTVEFRLQTETAELGQLQTQYAATDQSWPSNPFTSNPAPILDTADDVDAGRIVRPLFGLGTSMPSFRRRSAAPASSDQGGGAGVRPILLGLVGLVVALVAVAGALLVPDLITDSERSEFDRLLEDTRQGLTAATLATDPAAARLELELARTAVASAQVLRPLDSEATILEQEIAATLQQANAIVQPPELVELLDFGPQAALGFVQISGDVAFILDEAAGRVFAADLISGRTSVIFEAGQEYLFIGEFGGVTATNPIAVEWTATSLSASLTILDDSGSLFRFSEAGGTEAFRIPNVEVLGSADGLTVDTASILLLDAAGGVVWRFPILPDGSLDSGRTAIGRKELGEATDLAIAPDSAGGTIFISSSDGRIRRFVDGRDQGFPLTLDRPLLVPASLVIAQAANLLYIVDRGNDRILIVSLGGEVLLQIRDARLAGVRGIFIDELDQQIYYVTASTLLVSAMPEALRR
ncbi:MAG TPA: hypothetical protein QGF05_06320 [Dehalococcoidia bacterium]|nr:hypothetical protein [Dehalococcoidia bacterium]